MSKAKQTIKFSKFIPSETSFVVLEGYANSADDYDVTMKIGNGDETVTLFSSGWHKDHNAFLQAIKEGAEKMIEFNTKAMGLGKVKETPKPETKKKAAKK